MIRRPLLAVVLSCGLSASSWAYTPPACTGSQLYLDVPNANLFCPWIRELWREEISFGCGASNYCPHNPATREEVALIVGKALHEHLLGEGRPGALVHGVPSGMFEFLCNSTVPGVFMGLSRLTASWDGAAAACPAPYWVCTDGERGAAACNTTRADDTCDALDCGGNCIDLSAGDHIGWVADGGGTRFGFSKSEAGTAGQVFVCFSYPVWCCTRS